MWECEWWQNFKMNEKFKNHIRSNFPYKRPLSNDSLLGKKEMDVLMSILRVTELFHLN